MIPEPRHGRKLVVGAVALVKFRHGRSWGRILDRLRDAYESALIDKAYFADAPFSWISLIVRYGLEARETPSLMRISKRHGDLELSIEVDVRALLNQADDVVETVFATAIANALRAVEAKYSTPRIDPIHSRDSPPDMTG